MRNRRGFIAVVVAALLTGCGGDDESASESYANSVCRELSEWVSSIEEATNSLTEAGLSADRDDLEAAVEEATEATDDLADDLARLEPPETDDGDQAKEEVDRLATRLRQQVDSVKVTVASDDGAGTVVTSVASSVSTATTAAGLTFENLERLDEGGELGDAFRDSDDCDSLRDQIGELGS